MSLLAIVIGISAVPLRAAESGERPMYIQEYRVLGSQTLPPEEVEEAVYPFLGPGRTSTDVEKARAALEKAYQDKGFQTVQVQIPEQQVKRGIVLLEVVENKVLVSFFGEELHSPPSNITDGIRRPLFPSHGGDSRQGFGLLSNSAQERSRGDV